MPFGSDRTVKVNLKANVSDYVGKVTVATKATKDFADAGAKSATKHKASWDTVGKTALVGGAAIAVAVGLAVKSYADFEEKLSTVKAVSGATAGEMDKLSDAALKAGADTKFSASQAAEAEGELAKVGISTSDILGGALLGSLNLAAAGNLDLATAATYAGQAMKIFALNGKDVPHIADVLAAGANKSAADVGQLAQAMQQAGLVAAQTGLHLEDTVGVLSAFADNALIGSDAGTSLKTMLQRLTPQSATAAAEMERLGFSAYDSQGNFVGLEEVARRMQKSFGGLTTEQRNLSMGIIFGSDAIRASNVLFKLGAEGVKEYTAGVNDQGAAARVAAIQMDNLNGDLEQLRGSIDTALIKAGSAGNDSLRSLVQTATGAVNMFGELPEPIQQGAVAVGALTAAVLLLGGAAALTVPRVIALDVALKEATGGALGLRGAMAALGPVMAVAGVATAAVILGDYIGKATTATVATDGLADALTKFADTGDLSGSALDLFAGKGAGGLITNNIDSTSEALDRFAKSATKALDEGWDARLGRWQSFGSAQSRFQKQAEQLDGAFAQMVQNGHADEARKSYDKFIEAVRENGGNGPATKAAAAFTQYQAAIDGASSAQKTAAESATSLGGEVDGMAVSVEDATKAVDDLVKSLADAGLVQLSARDAARAYQEAIDGATDAAKKNGKTLDIHTKKGRENQAALDGVAKSAIDSAQAVYEKTKATKGAEPAESAFRASLLKSRDGLVKTGEKFGLTKKQAENYADSVLNIPAVKNTKVKLTGTGPAISALERLRLKMLEIRDKHVSVSVTVGTVNKQAANPGLLEGRASGGPTRANTPYLTGENGPELVQFDKPGFVHSASATRSIFASGQYAASSGGSSSGAPSINYHGPVYQEDPNAFARKQVTAQQDAITMHNLRGVN